MRGVVYVLLSFFLLSKVIQYDSYPAPPKPLVHLLSINRILISVKEIKSTEPPQRVPDDWDRLSVEYRKHIEALKRRTGRNRIKGKAELHMKAYPFWYGEDIFVDVKRNMLVYPMKTLVRDGMLNPNPSDENVRLLLGRGRIKACDVVYDRVGVVPYRNHYNLFHFLEGTNTIIEYYLNNQLNASFSYLYLAHDRELHSFPGWFHGYLMDVLSGIPEAKRPVILERAALLHMNKRILFKRAVILHLNKPFVLFRSPVESRWIRGNVYRHFNISMVKSSPRQITYVSRYCNSSRCNENDVEVVNGLKSLWNRTVHITFNGMSYEEQVGLMTETDMLISIHGAQLTNLVFMHAGGIVMEIMNPYFVAHFYRDLSRMCEMQYYEFRQTSIVKDIPSSIRKTWWNPTVNYHTLVRMDYLLFVVKRAIKEWCCICFKHLE